MPRSLIPALGAAALLLAMPAAATTAVYGPYTYSISVKTKPDDVHGKFPRGLVTGFGTGTFFVQGHHMDRDQLVWNVHRVTGGMTLYQGGKLLAKFAATSGVQFERYGSTSRSVGFKGRLAGSGVFHCAKPAAYLTLDDTDPIHGNTDGFQFGACGSYANFSGRGAKLTISVKPG